MENLILGVLLPLAGGGGGAGWFNYESWSAVYGGTGSSGSPSGQGGKGGNYGSCLLYEEGSGFNPDTLKAPTAGADGWVYIEYGGDI